MCIKQVISKVIHKLKKYILECDSLIKMIEKLRGLYNYPNMLGRKYHNGKGTNKVVLVFAAHPDDDVLGLGTTLYRHHKKGDNIVVVFTTNGSRWNKDSWRQSKSRIQYNSDIRYNEAVKALSLIQIPKENIFCLGFPDNGICRYVNSMAIDVVKIVSNCNPKCIYVHCIEGGHPDHDITSYVVKSVCKKIGYSNVFEWTEYNPSQPIGSEDVKFLPTTISNILGTKLVISEEEYILKRKMLSSHRSQNVERYASQGECIRNANFSNLDKELFEFCRIPINRLKKVVKSLG